MKLFALLLLAGCAYTQYTPDYIQDARESLYRDCMNGNNLGDKYGYPVRSVIEWMEIQQIGYTVNPPPTAYCRELAVVRVHHD